MKRAKRPQVGQGVPSALEPPTGDDVLRRALGAVASNLASYTGGKNEAALVSVSVRRRAPSNYIAVARRLNDVDCVYQVTFGAGRSFLEALLSLDKAIAKGAWKRDRFAEFT